MPRKSRRPSPCWRRRTSPARPGVEEYAQVDRTATSDFLEIQEGILLDIMRMIEECGTAIAFPSQTTYHVHANAGQGEQRRTAAARN
jgi:hypothetical protein